MSFQFSSLKYLLTATSIAVGAGVLLFFVGVLRNGSLDYWYLIYNLALAVIPLGLAWWVLVLLKTHAWTNWRIISILVAWLLFLPNSFYIVTDFIHLLDGPRADVVQDVVMLMQFSILGLAAGFVSMAMLQRAVEKRAGTHVGIGGAAAVLFLSSFAIYLGRELRWNSWDIITNPTGLIGDTLAIVVSPLAHPEAFFMTISFFLMLTSLYFMAWFGGHYLKRQK